MVGSRAVIVVDPDGRIAEVIPRFNQVDPGAYEALKAAIDRVTPDPDGSTFPNDAGWMESLCRRQQGGVLYSALSCVFKTYLHQISVPTRSWFRPTPV
jgi:hypothetical protein